jgi:hypothetical protein
MELNDWLVENEYLKSVDGMDPDDLQIEIEALEEIGVLKQCEHCNKYHPADDWCANCWEGNIEKAQTEMTCIRLLVEEKLCDEIALDDVKLLEDFIGRIEVKL